MILDIIATFFPLYLIGWAVNDIWKGKDTQTALVAMVLSVISIFALWI